MGPLPEVFFKVALKKAIVQLQAPNAIKSKVYAESLKLHNTSATQRQAVKALDSILSGVKWSWPDGEQQLHSEGIDVDDDELLGLFFRWQEFFAYRLFRQGQIRALLKADFGHVIHVNADMPIAPCGFKNGETLKPTADTLKKLPPCDRLNCCCSWTLMHPKS